MILEHSLGGDEVFMREAMRMAEFARGHTSPNPLVGAVIVQGGSVIAAGWHRRAGEPHAEIHALNMAGERARGATLYVTLEPCAHYGRTGPCADAVIKAGIARAVVGITDPNPLVSGKGISRLKEAGIEVVSGVLAAEISKQNEIFLKWITTQMPFVTLKTAMSLDGKIATVAGESKWITGEESRAYVQRMRAQNDAILVGIGTVLADNPALTVRLSEYAGRQKKLLRVVIDNEARTPLTANVVADGLAPTIIFVSERAPAEKIAALCAAGVEVIQLNGENIDTRAMLAELGKREITSLLVEGGGTVNFSFVEADLVDKVQAFIAPLIIGGESAKTPVEGNGAAALGMAMRLRDITLERVGEDILLTGYRRSGVTDCSQE